jgi:hypothetical protein
MRLILPTCLLLLGAAGLAPLSSAAEAPAPIAAIAQKPMLGIEADAGAVAGSFDPGVKVASVLADSTAAHMGMLSGDVIQSVNQQPIVSMDDLQKTLAPLKLGDAIAVDVLRQGKKQQLSGVMMPKPPPPMSIGEKMRALEKELAELRKRAEHPPDLAESLENLVKELNKLQKELPAATEAFKKLYPNGDFSIKIEINVTSDKSAANPVHFGNGLDPKDAHQGQDKGAQDATASPPAQAPPQPGAAAPNPPAKAP